MKFSEKIMNLRKSKEWSQDDFAQKLGVTRQTISKWELDQTTPDMNKLIEISKLFEISLDELINDIEKSTLEGTYKENAIEKNNRKISLKIFIVGLIVALILCGIGFIKQNNAKKTNEENYNIAYKESEENVEKAKKRISEISSTVETLESQITSMELEISSMKNERDGIFMTDRGFSDRYYDKDSEIKAKEAELSNLKSQLTGLQNEVFVLNNTNYTSYYKLVEPIEYLIFYYIGAGVIGLAILISLIYFLVTRRK